MSHSCITGSSPSFKTADGRTSLLVMCDKGQFVNASSGEPLTSDSLRCLKGTPYGSLSCTLPFLLRFPVSLFGLASIRPELQPPSVRLRFEFGSV